MPLGQHTLIYFWIKKIIIQNSKQAKNITAQMTGKKVTVSKKVTLSSKSFLNLNKQRITNIIKLVEKIILRRAVETVHKLKHKYVSHLCYLKVDD